LNDLDVLDSTLFEYLIFLEYLNLDSNKIEYLDVGSLSKNLKVLNLANNRIMSMSIYPRLIIYDFFSLSILKMSNNKLANLSYFDANNVVFNEAVMFKEMHLDKNEITQINYFSFMVNDLTLLNLSMNKIEFIEKDAFLNCRSLVKLVLSYNLLANLTANNFYFLFSLSHLDLSFNRIDSIEMNTFESLNKLKELLLSFNRLHSLAGQYISEFD
jgi:Leucine-rich repeat (LRR) protein